MGLGHSPSIVTNGLVLCYDFGNFEKAFGTTNLGLNNSLTIYNNVPSHVTATLTQTSETYKGSPVWIQTLTPTTATGVSYLTAGNNPGIGVYHNGGGGTGGTYTGHSIFFRPTVPMHSSPIFTHYSNIAGYQSTNNYDDMRDGWYRANVVWYDTVTRSDAKYWAINPASATLNVPITIYWAAPFREDRNYTNFVSAYSSGTRGSGNGALNLVSNTTLSGTLTNNPTYNSSNSGSLVFNGSTQYVTSGALTGSFSSFTVIVWFYPTSVTNYQNVIDCNYSLYSSGNIGPRLELNSSGSLYWIYSQDTSNNNNFYLHFVLDSSLVVNTWNCAAITYSAAGNTSTTYYNGSPTGLSRIVSGTPTGFLGTMNDVNIGRGFLIGGANRWFSGRVSNVQIYNRALTAAEVAQNFNSHRARYGV